MGGLGLKISVVGAVLALGWSGSAAAAVPRDVVRQADGIAAVLGALGRPGVELLGPPVQEIVRGGCSRTGRTRMRCGFNLGGYYWGRGTVWLTADGRVGFALRVLRVRSSEGGVSCRYVKRVGWRGAVVRTEDLGTEREIRQSGRWRATYWLPRPIPEHPCHGEIVRWMRGA